MGWTLFHDTEQETIDKIVNTQVTGYLPMLSGSEVGAIWGSSTYFARDAQYSHTYTVTLNARMNERCCSTG
jgi:hypothetical protein